MQLYSKGQVISTHAPPHYILEDSNFDFRNVVRCGLDIPKEKWLNNMYLQTVETLFRRHIFGL